MPIHWKILSKKYLLNILIFTLFFIFITIFFKLSSLSKYFVAGIEMKELLLLLGVFVYKCLPFALSITGFISAYVVCSNAKKNNELKAFASLGLSPQKLFTPLIILSLFLSLSNAYISFVATPYINTSLTRLLTEKKANIDLLSSFSRRFSKKNVFVSIDSKKGSEFLLVKAGHNFSWLLCDQVTEDKEGLYFHHPSYFQASSEEGDFDSIILSHDEKTFIPKNTIFSLFPESTLRLPPINYSTQEKFSRILYLLYPLIFTMLGIALSLHIYFLPCIFLCGYTFSSLAVSSMQNTPIASLLSIIAFLSSLLLYTIILRKFKLGGI